RRGQQRQLKPVWPKRPGDVNVVRIPRPARGDDRDLVEAVCPAGLLSAADFYFHCESVADGPDGLPDLGTYLKRLGLHLIEQPLDPRGVDDSGPKMLGRFGAAGHSEAQRLDRRGAAVARRDIPRQERVAGADRRTRLL